MLLRILKNIVKRFLAAVRYDQWANKSWSQEGEDLVLHRIFEKQNTGFYVDIGAHHPKRFSNTHLFYIKGWTGLNIDAMPGCMDAFKKMRPRDINIEMGVAGKKSQLNYHIFNDPALNSFSFELTNERDQADDIYKLQKIVKVPVLPLHEILSNYCNDISIDFMSVDVEGLDLEVLKSNDWKKYRPKYLIVELLNIDMSKLINHEITNYLLKQDYKMYGKLVHSVIFHDTKTKL